jgi:hypothetical protein
VITPFGLRHIWLMRELQSSSIQLDLKSALLEEPTTPLRVALRGYFLKSSAGVFTYVLRASDRTGRFFGFAQARAHRSGLAWEIVRMAPVLDHFEDAATIWYRLLLHLCIAAGEWRVQRLFARLPEGSAAEDVFRQASFVAYCHEQVFRREPRPKDGETWPRPKDGETWPRPKDGETWPRPKNGETWPRPKNGETWPRQENGETSPGKRAARQLGLRMQAVQPEDSLDLRRLWCRVTPRPVLQAEGSDELGGSSPLFEPPLSDTEQSYVVRSHDGETRGYVCILPRARGVWLRVMVQPDTGDSVAEMLTHALVALQDHARPIYCAVREYEGGMQAALEERGFTPIDTYSLLVKHTTVRVKEPRRKLVPALEKRVEVTPTVSRSEAGDH